MLLLHKLESSSPVNILAGLVVMIVTLPALILGLDKGMVDFGEMLFKLLKTL